MSRMVEETTDKLKVEKERERETER